MDSHSNNGVPEKRRGGLLLALLLSGVVWAEEAPLTNEPIDVIDLSLDQVMKIPVDTIFSVSRRAQKTWQAPASVTIVTRDDFKIFGYRSLADALRSAPGIYTTYDRWYTYLGVRGFSRPGDFNSRGLLLVDGHRANDNIYDAGLAGPEAIVDFDLVDRVEVIRGPSSSVYGSNAFFGVYDVIMRRGGAIQGIETAASRGSFGSYKTRLTAGQQLDNGLEFLLSGSYYESDGPAGLYFSEYDAPELNNGVAERLDYERTYHLYGSLAYRDLTLTASVNSRDKGIPTGLYEAYFNSPGEHSIDGTRFVDLKYRRHFTNGLNLSSRVSYHGNPYRGWYPYNVASVGDPPDIVFNRDIIDGQWWGIETTASRRFRERFTLTAGFEYRDNFEQHQVNLDAGDPPVVYGDSRSSTQVTGLYAQSDVSLTNDLVLSAGVRYDYYSSFGDTVNPRVGLMYRPQPITVLKLLYGSAFRAPNVYELGFDASYYSGNRSLRPETIASYELVWEQQLSRPLRFVSSVFYNEVQGLISLREDTELLTFANDENVLAYGAELGLEGRWDNLLMVRASCSLQRTEDGDSGNGLSNAPPRLAKLHLRVPLWHDRAFVGLEAQYIGPVRTTQPGRIGGYTIANLTLFSKDLLGGVQASASAYNLFDRKYAVTASSEYLQRTFPQDGRSLRFELTKVF
jgi:iron complex outermembrane receptor protein